MLSPTSEVVDDVTAVLGAHASTFVVRTADVDGVLEGAVLHRELRDETRGR